MANTSAFCTIFLSLDVPRPACTPSVLARCRPHTSHLLSVVDSGGMVDGRLDLLRLDLELWFRGRGKEFALVLSPVLHTLPHTLSLDA